MCQFDFGLQGRKRKPVTKQSLCRDDMLGFIYHTVSLFLLSQLICMCLLWSLAVTLRKLPPPPHHLFILIALYLLPSLPPFNSFVSLPPFNDSGHGHPFFRALKWRVPALTENRISLKNWRVRQMWCACVYMCVHVWICLPTEHDSHGACPFVLEYTHNGSEPKYCRGKLHLR